MFSPSPTILVALMHNDLKEIAKELGFPEYDNEEVLLEIRKLKEVRMSLSICRSCGRGWQALSESESCPFCTKAAIAASPEFSKDILLEGLVLLYATLSHLALRDGQLEERAQKWKAKVDLHLASRKGKD